MQKLLIIASAFFLTAGSAFAKEVPFVKAGLFKGTSPSGEACLVEAENTGKDYGRGVKVSGPNYKVHGFSFYPSDREVSQSGCGETPYVKGNTISYVHKQEEMSMNFLGTQLTFTGPDHQTLQSVKTKRGGEGFIRGMACARYNNAKWDSECNGLQAIDKKEYDALMQGFRPEPKRAKKAAPAPAPMSEGDASMDVDGAN